VDCTLGSGGLKTSLECILVAVEAKRVGDCSNAVPRTSCYLVGEMNAAIPGVMARLLANDIHVDASIMDDRKRPIVAFIDHTSPSRRSSHRCTQYQLRSITDRSCTVVHFLVGPL
jgi:hypothetical protein